MFDKSDGGRPRPSSGAFYDVCAGSFEKCMEFIRANAVTRRTACRPSTASPVNRACAGRRSSTSSRASARPRRRHAHVDVRCTGASGAR
ncbi:MAG: hypothetical protein ACLTYW_00260 [Collinsella sp.]